MTEITFRSDIGAEVVDHMGDDMSPIRAARVSTGTDVGANPKADLGLLNYLMRERHHVPFETQIMTFFINAPIFVTRQILKHRISTINEASGRYRELEGDFYVPDMQRPVKQVGKTGDYEFEHDETTSHMARGGIIIANRVAWEEYQTMLDRGVSKEVARMVLPMNIYSQMYLTMNTRALLNFFHLRTSYYGSHPQYEVEKVAQAMLNEWSYLYPETHQAALMAGIL